MISIVIPAYNEAKWIGSCLKVLTQQTALESFEVIVVDNNSTDTTGEEAKKFAKLLRLRLITEKQPGRGIARAAGFAAARGEIILSTDADAIVPPDWIETLYEELKNPNIGAVTGTCNIADSSLVKNALFNWIQPTAMFVFRLVFGFYWLSGFSFGIKKSIYERAGGFVKDLQTQEDIALSFAVRKLTYIRLVNLPVLVSGRRFKQGLLKGFMPYLTTFIDYFLLKKRVYLSNER